MDHAFDGESAFDFVLVFLQAADHFESLQDIYYVINTSSPNLKLLNAVIHVYKVPLARFGMILGAKKFQEFLAVFAQTLFQSRGLGCFFVMIRIMVGSLILWSFANYSFHTFFREWRLYNGLSTNCLGGFCEHLRWLGHRLRLLNGWPGVNALCEHWRPISSSYIVLSKVWLALNLLFFVKWLLKVLLNLNWRQKVLLLLEVVWRIFQRIEGRTNVRDGGIAGRLDVERLIFFGNSLLNPTFENLKIGGKLVRSKHMIVFSK